jgi:hypothetical protein
MYTCDFLEMFWDRMPVSEQEFFYCCFIAHMLVYQKGVHYNGVRLFNRLPSSIKQLSHDPKRFRTVLKGLLYAHSFYSIDEYFRCKMDWSDVKWMWYGLNDLSWLLWLLRVYWTYAILRKWRLLLVSIYTEIGIRYVLLGLLLWDASVV